MAGRNRGFLNLNRFKSGKAAKQQFKLNGGKKAAPYTGISVKVKTSPR